jgi:hypothetical protein
MLFRNTKNKKGVKGNEKDGLYTGSGHGTGKSAVNVLR